MKQFVKSALAASALCCLMAASQASIVRYQTSLSGANENPANPSPAIGFVTADYDSILHTLTLHASWSGLLGVTTAAHIHCCTLSPGNVGVAVTPVTLTGFPNGVNGGTYDRVLDLTSAATYTPGFISNFAGGVLANAEPTLISAFNNQRAYFNIHTNLYPGGEIRGFLNHVPEPMSLALVGVALAGLVFSRRPRRPRAGR